VEAAQVLLAETELILDQEQVVLVEMEHLHHIQEPQHFTLAVAVELEV
jgi:hypothetical protein